MAPLKIGVLLSGSGSNLQAIIDAIAAGRLNAEIRVVISSRPDAYGLVRAKEAGIQTIALSKDVYADYDMANEAIAAELVRAGCEYVVMAGYMRMVTDPILMAFPSASMHPLIRTCSAPHISGSGSSPASSALRRSRT